MMATGKTFWIVLASAALALPAAAQDGVSIATVVVAKDSPSAQQAIVIGQIARQGFARNPRYEVLDVEIMLSGGEDSTGRLAELKKAEEALETGMAAYDAFEVDAALESLAEAVGGYERAVGGMADITPLVDAYRFQGAAYALKGEQEAATEAFLKALVLDEGADLSGGQFPDTVQAIFEAARDQVATLQTGSLTVYAAPAAAEVWVDGGFRGSAPMTVTDLQAGRHYVRIVRDGYVAFGEAVDIAAGGEETVQATLRPTSGLSEFEKTARKLQSGDQRAAADLAAKLKVEQLFWATVEATGKDVKVSGFLTDGVGGGVLATGDKSFTTTSPRFRGDVELWLAENFRKEGSATATNTNTANNGESFMPSAPVEPPTPGTLIAGWIIAPLSVLPFLVGIVSYVGAFYFFDTYYLGAELLGGVTGGTGVLDQRDAFSNDGALVLTLQGVLGIAADVLMVLSAVVLATGVTLIVFGLNEKAEIDDVLSLRAVPGGERYALE